MTKPRMSLVAKIGKKGRIRSGDGEHTGFFIRIKDDAQNAGGYLILLWEDTSPTGYDYWVETTKDLDQFFGESGWDIEWLE
jgi:hypothetical protein